MNHDAMSGFTPGAPSTWSEIFGETKRFETAIKASAQIADWMGGKKRDQWVAFCNTVDNQHPAGFATAILALDISIMSKHQAGTWMSSDRAAWVAACRQAGAKNFEWGNPRFVCSGLDGCEVLLEQIVGSISVTHLSAAFKAGDYKTYGSLFDAVKAFECAIKASSQEKSWMDSKRASWVTFCNNPANHTPSGFATAVLALDLSVPASNNLPSWSHVRPIWLQRCRNAGAVSL
jgi:hypothetical protein